MGFFEKLTGTNTPEYKRAIEAMKAHEKAKSDAVNAHMNEDFARRRGADEKWHTERAASLNQQIAAGQQDLEAIRRERVLNTTFGLLRNRLSSTFSMAIGNDKTDIKAVRSATDSMRTELDNKLQELRTDPKVRVSDVEAWALSKVGDDDRFANSVKQSFNEFTQELQKHGATVE